MSLSKRSAAIGATVVALIAFIAGGIAGFRDYAPGRVSSVMWPWLMWLSALAVWIPLAIRWRRRRRSS